MYIFSNKSNKWNINKTRRPFWFDLLKVKVSLYSQSRASNWVSILPEICKNAWLPDCTKMPFDSQRRDFLEIQSCLLSKIPTLLCITLEPPGQGHLWPLWHNINNPQRGLYYNVIYQESGLWAFYFQRNKYFTLLDQRI